MSHRNAGVFHSKLFREMQRIWETHKEDFVIEPSKEGYSIKTRKNQRRNELCRELNKLHESGLLPERVERDSDYERIQLFAANFRKLVPIIVSLKSLEKPVAVTPGLTMVQEKE